MNLVKEQIELKTGDTMIDIYSEAVNKAYLAIEDKMKCMYCGSTAGDKGLFKTGDHESLDEFEARFDCHSCKQGVLPSMTFYQLSAKEPGIVLPEDIRQKIVDIVLKDSQNKASPMASISAMDKLIDNQEEINKKVATIVASLVAANERLVDDTKRNTTTIKSLQFALMILSIAFVLYVY